jgi:hypothetical protein
MPVSGRRLAVVALVVTMIVWGSSFVVTKLVLDEAGPFAVTVLRFGFGLSVLLPFAYRSAFLLPAGSLARSRRWARSMVLCGGVIAREAGTAEERAQTVSNPYARHNEQSKANFDHVYDLPDPRGYYQTLGALDYRAPEHGSRVFSALLRTVRAAHGTTPKVLDLCCSYGVNAALLKLDLTLDDLYARYGSGELAGLTPEELAASDANFYAERRRLAPPEVVGTDVAANAVSYALRAGLLDAGTAEDLENNEPTEGLRRAARGTGLVTVTGGVGYVWQRTFERVLSCVADGGSVPWVAAFAVRFVDYAPIAAVLYRYGLVTEKLSTRTFKQRRFENPGERDHVLRQLAEAGMDPAGKEEAGWYHADLYLSRSAAQVSEVPADELLGASGVLDY